MSLFSRLLPNAIAASLIAVGLGSQLPAVAQPLAANGRSGHPTYSAEVESRIARITADILPPYVIDEPSRVKTSLAERMQALAVPGVSIAVINDGKLEWARGFGVAKVDGPPVTTETMFAAASVSKPVSAFGALKLVQEGKIDLDTDVNRYLKSWKLPENGFTTNEKVTLRLLLTHTAGTTTHGFPGYVPGTPVPTLQQILDGQAPANTPAVRVNVTPGTIWRYSGGGYTIAQQMVLDVTGLSFRDYQDTTVLQPLGMKNSSYEQPLPPSRAAQAATPYGRDGQPITGGARIDPSLMAAGLWTTPSDLALYVMEVQQAKAGRSSKVLNKTVINQMLTRCALKEWGLGPELGGTPGARYFAHAGDDPGFHNKLVGYENGDGAIVMTNGDNGGRLGSELIRTIAQTYGWADFKPVVRTVTPVSSHVTDGLLGTYQNGRYSTVHITRLGDQVFSQTAGAKPVRMYPSSDRTWFFADPDLQFIVDADASGKARSIVSRQRQYDSPLTKLADAEASRPGDDLAAKIRGGAPDPRAEATLRRMFDELRNNAPDYSKMTARMASITKQQLSNLNATLRALPAISTLTFKSIAPNGADVFQMANGDKLTEWRILLTAEGKVETVAVVIGSHRPGSDVTLRRLIETIAAGQPSYQAMTPVRAEFVRANLAQQQRDFAAYGPIQSMWFVSADSQRGEMFEVTHANARINWTLLLDGEGKVVSLARQPVP
jgi:CubicO group peptidase (beta-lactamase class C family)